nr:MAG TPA: hypothetical protein [Caudoviricetes sp.]
MITSAIFQIPLLYVPNRKRPSLFMNIRCTMPSAFTRDIPEFPSAKPWILSRLFSSSSFIQIDNG